MTQRNRVLSLLVLTVVLMIAAIGCGPQVTITPVAGGVETPDYLPLTEEAMRIETLVICAAEEAKTLEGPPGSAGGALRALFSPDLVHFDANYMPTDEGMLAALPDTSDETLKQNDDGTISMRLALEDNHKWSDETDLLAEDFVRGADLGWHPEILSIEATDLYELAITVTGDTPYPYIPAITPLPEGFDIKGGTSLSLDTAAGDYFLAADEGNTWTLEMNPHSPGLPEIEEITVNFFPTETDAEAAMTAGSCDLLLNGNAGEMAGVNTLHQETPYIEMLVFNMNTGPGGAPIFAEESVRLAVAAAIDRVSAHPDLPDPEGWTDALYDADHWLYDLDEAAPAPVDLGLADSLLTQAGWSGFAGDGTRTTAGISGEYPCGLGSWAIPADSTLEPVLIYPAEDHTREGMASMIAANLMEAGIKVRLNPVSSERYFAPDGPLATRDFDLALIAMPIEPDPDFISRWVGKDVYIHPLELTLVYQEELADRWLATAQQVEVIAPNAIPSADNDYTGLNFSGYCDTDVNKEIGEIERGDLILAASAAEFQRVWEALLAAKPILPLYLYMKTDQAKATVCGISPLPYEPLTWNIATWTIDESGACGG